MQTTTVTVRKCFGNLLNLAVVFLGIDWKVFSQSYSSVILTYLKNPFLHGVMEWCKRQLDISTVAVTSWCSVIARWSCLDSVDRRWWWWGLTVCGHEAQTIPWFAVVLVFPGVVLILKFQIQFCCVSLQPITVGVGGLCTGWHYSANYML